MSFMSRLIIDISHFSNVISQTTPAMSRKNAYISQTCFTSQIMSFMSHSIVEMSQLSNVISRTTSAMSQNNAHISQITCY